MQGLKRGEHHALLELFKVNVSSMEGRGEGGGREGGRGEGGERGLRGMKKLELMEKLMRTRIGGVEFRGDK